MKTLNVLKTLTLCAVMTPGVALADTVSTADLDAFRSAVTAAGCMVNSEATAAAVESATGFDEAKLEAIVTELRGMGEIADVDEDGGIQLTSGECAN
ncbi:MAG: hypothetical protein JXJ18_02600 [Rhodobacteraceae bacterium]|nr:hypothetical protein [Paracoccaceae bacterium]